MPELVLEDLRYRVYRDASLTARGTAARATYRRDTTDFDAEQIRLTLEEGRNGQMLLTAPFGRGNARSRQYFAWGGIQLRQRGTTLLTEEAHYSPVDGLIRGEHPVTIRGSGYTAHGPGFLFDPRTEELNVLGGAKVTAEQRTAR